MVEDRGFCISHFERPIGLPSICSIFEKIKIMEGTYDIRKFQSILEQLHSLSVTELDKFLEEARKIAQRKKTPNSRSEELVLKIKTGGPSRSFRDRYQELNTKESLDFISKEEHQELLQKVKIFEEWEVERANYLIELSQIEKLTPRELNKKYELKSSPNLGV